LKEKKCTVSNPFNQMLSVFSCTLPKDTYFFFKNLKEIEQKLIAFKEKKYLTRQKQNDWLGFVILNKKTWLKVRQNLVFWDVVLKTSQWETNVAVKQRLSQTKVESNKGWVKQRLSQTKVESNKGW
jgi:hypothetical protein